MTTALPMCDYADKKVLSALNSKFNNISSTLQIETTRDSVRHGMLLNRFESTDSTINIDSMEFSDFTFYDRESGEFNELTEEELNDVAFGDKQITLESKRYISDLSNMRSLEVDFSKVEMSDSTIMEFTAKNNDYFTFQELLDNIITFEKIDRPKTKWFGGVDCHHVYFEGIHLSKTGTYSVCWGS